MGIGSLDRVLTMKSLLRPDVDYRRPRGGGAAIFDLVGDLRGKRILDLGCGQAPFRRTLTDRGARWTGVDLSGGNCSVHADAGRLPFPDASFDLVLSAAVLEHLPEPDPVMRETRRVLRPGGILFGYSAFLEPLHGMSYMHLSHLGLEVLLLRHGFRPRRIYPSHVSLPYHLDGILFPKPVPVLQGLVRMLARALTAGLLSANRTAREGLMRARRLSREERRKEREQYRLLLSLRYAVGFNFIAEREEGVPDIRSGYAALVKEG